MEQIPPLENGDRLSRAEFERRYDAMPALKKAELIEGVVFIPSAVPIADIVIPRPCSLPGWECTKTTRRESRRGITAVFAWIWTTSRNPTLT